MTEKRKLKRTVTIQRKETKDDGEEETKEDSNNTKEGDQR